MSTTIRPELSEKNRYWIEKHRYYELKHFCLQYPIWKKAHSALNSFGNRPYNLIPSSKTNKISDPTAKCAEARMFYSDRMELVEHIANETDTKLQSYILKAVTEGYSFDYLKARLEIPCSKDTYYDLYRRFFWLLNNERK